VIEQADVVVYDVYSGGSYLGRMVEVEREYNIFYVGRYEYAGDKIDDTCISVVSVDTVGNKLGQHTLCATYRTPDMAITLEPGISVSFTITYSKSYEAGISMSIGVKYIPPLDGLFKVNIQSGTTEEVTYTLRAPSGRTVTYLIDFLGPYDRNTNTYPIAWAFYTIDPPANHDIDVDSVDTGKTPSRYYLHVVTLDVHGKLINEETVVYKTPPIIHKLKRVRLVDVRAGNGTIVLMPRIEDLDKVKSAIIKIWRFEVVNGKLDIKLPLEKASDITMNALEILRNGMTLFKNRGSAVKVVIDVEYSDGSRDGFEYIAVGYDIAIPRG